MNALDLLSDDEDDADVNDTTEATEPDAKRQKVVQLDFKDLQRLGYAAGGEEDEKAKMENAFSSFEKVKDHEKKSRPGAPIEIPGFSTTYQTVIPGDPTRFVANSCKVTVHATGMMSKSGKVFWETRETQSGQPSVFIAGEGKRVVGWEQGCLGMRIKETRKLWIPSHEGYGERGFPDWEIPPNCDLEFTIDCVDIAGSAGCKKTAKLDGWGDAVPEPDTLYHHPSSSFSTSFTSGDAHLEHIRGIGAMTPAANSKAADAAQEWAQKCSREPLQEFNREGRETLIAQQR